MTQYRAGSDFERYVRADLHDEGYFVLKSGGSKTKVDLIAIKEGQVLLIQCKRDGRVSPAERTELLRVAALLPGLALPIVASKIRGGVRYERLTGVGPADRVGWVADEAA